MSWGEIYNTSWWGVALDTARTVKARPDFFGSQLNLLTSEQPNLVTNGDFSENGVVNGTPSSYARGWYSNDSDINITNNELVVTNGASVGGRAYATDGVNSLNVVTSGKFYKLVYTITENNDNATVSYHTGGTYVTAPNTVGTHTIYYEAAGTIFILRNNLINSTVKIDNVSVQLVRAELDQIEAKKCLADWIHTTALKDLNN